MTVTAQTFATIRFGYGFHPDQPPPGGAGDLLDQLSDPRAVPLIYAPLPLDERRRLIRQTNIELRDGDPKKGQKLRRGLRERAWSDAVDRLAQRVFSPYGFYERLAAFWANHFTVARRSAQHMSMISVFEPAAIRPHIAGYFEDLLIACTTHPAMLIYLDQNMSYGPTSHAGRRRGRGLNENLAREVLELHTLGVGGGYTQTDVREFAELLTGFAVGRHTTEFRFVAKRAEPGAEVVLGRQYGGARPRLDDAFAALRDLAVHPSTARHIARKLAVHFVADAPEHDLVRHIEAAYRRTDGHLPSVYAALLEHPAAWRGFGQKIKQPRDLLASALRAMGITRAERDRLHDKKGAAILGKMRHLNQAPHNAPGPDGWPEEAEAWITPQGLAGRLEVAAQLGKFAAKRSRIDPRRFAEQTLREALSPTTAFAVGGAPERWEGLALTFASPEFNRR